MVKLVGPLHSDSASGQFAKSAVYSKSLGQNVCRKYTYQNNVGGDNAIETAKIRTTFARIFGIINRYDLRNGADLVTIKEFYRADAKADNYWYHALSLRMLGAGFELFREALVWYAEFFPDDREKWDLWGSEDLPGVSSPVYGEGHGDIGESRAVLEWGFFRAGYIKEVSRVFPIELLPAGGDIVSRG